MNANQNNTMARMMKGCACLAIALSALALAGCASRAPMVADTSAAPQYD